MQMNEVFECHDSKHVCYWHPLDSTTAFVGDASASFRTMDNFDGACDVAKSCNMCDKSISSPTEHRHCHISPTAVSGTDADAHMTSSDAHLLWNFDGIEHCVCNYRNVPVRSRPSDCCYYGSAGVWSSDKLHRISADKLRTTSSEFPTAGSVRSCSYGGKMFPLLHSAHCATSYLAENPTTECCDMNSVRTASPYYHSHASHQHPMFTNCQNTGFSPYNEQYQSSPRVRQSSSMNELDDIDIPLQDTSSVNSSMLDEMVGNNLSTATEYSFSQDVDCSGKRDNLYSPLQKEQHQKHTADDTESVWHIAAKIKERTSELNAQKSFGMRPQQHVLTNCQKTGCFSSYNDNREHCQSAPYVRQSSSMSDVDDNDFSLHDASSVNSSMLNEMVGNNISTASDSSFLYDVGCLASGKPESVSSCLQKEERRKPSADNPEFSKHTAAKMKAKTNEINGQNCFEADASIQSPSLKPPLLGRKAKKRVLVNDEKSRPAVAQKTVSDDSQNRPTYNGAVENDLCTNASECRYVRRTYLDAQSRTDPRVAASGNVKSSLHKENSNSEDADAADYLTAEHSERSDAGTDPVLADKPRRASGSHFRVESNVKAETPAVQHRRRPVRKTSRAAPRQKSAKHGNSEQCHATNYFRLKQFLSSVDWFQLHQNIGLFFLFPLCFCTDCCVTGREYLHS